MKKKSYYEKMMADAKSEYYKTIDDDDKEIDIVLAKFDKLEKEAKSKGFKIKV